MISLGYTQKLGTVLLSVLGLANLVGRIVGSVLKLRCRAFPAVYNMFYVCPLIALGHTLIITLQTQDHLMIAACIVHGLGFGILNAMAPVMMYDLVEGDKFMHAVGLLNFSFGIGNLLSNFIGGRIRDVSGSYDLAYEIGIAASLLVTIDFVVIARITKKRQKERKSLLLPDDLKIIPYKTIN
ncbi:uncharacterized protein LOC128549245 [Mercenaria mercenaria]|uniref:uncharacterized protein LOC128549245 n=1 Tax=Mercenaria mercenaria TaxID=6596 RepID=UPI00234F6C40|nr:uncharacterized protein LOC128549245 [Mercenaria mercenaria]